MFKDLAMIHDAARQRKVLDFIDIEEMARFSEVPEPKAPILPNLSYDDANYAAVKSQVDMQNADFLDQA
ncbi:hypothetical protein PABG_11751 [Paracoccidioides brasiliensis Pb03]|nr:hypothetical protein PABG_11751 [Paracoccidioides brasiliensis Pb03]